MDSRHAQFSSLDCTEMAGTKPVQPRFRVISIDLSNGKRCINADSLQKNGFSIEPALTLTQAAERASIEAIDLILLTLSRENAELYHQLASLTVCAPRLPIIVLAHEPSLSSAVRVMRAGAADYLALPVCRRRLVEAVFDAMDTSSPHGSVPWRSPAERAVRTFAEFEKDIIENAITAAGGNIKRAARLLDIDPSTIHRKRRRWRAASLESGILIN